MISTPGSALVSNFFIYLFFYVCSEFEKEKLYEFPSYIINSFGREGNVTLGSVGVVALSLAKQVRRESVAQAGPIPGSFLKKRRGYYTPQVYTVNVVQCVVPDAGTPHFKPSH